MKELAILFLKLGTIAFGGPAAHIALMEEEVVRRRQWMTSQEFLDLLGAANLLPGPSSTELAIFIGYRREGLRGLLLAGVCFIMPAMLIVWALARLYVRLGTFPAVSGVLLGFKAVIIAVIIQAVYNLSKSAINTWKLATIAAISILLFASGLNAILVLLLAGLASLLGKKLPGSNLALSLLSAISFGLSILSSKVYAAISEQVPERASISGIFFIFLKVGSVVFGSGYVLLAFLQKDLVDHLHWLTQSQLLDAVAVGQFTPGPVFTTATFIGYLLGGNLGAVVATIGIFLPAFVLVLLGSKMVPKIKQSAQASAFLKGVSAASLALMVVVAFQLAKATLTDVTMTILSVVALLLLIKFRINSIWLILCGGIVGFIRMKGTL